MTEDKKIITSPPVALWTPPRIMRPITEGWKAFQEGLSWGENRRRTPDKPANNIEPSRNDVQQMGSKSFWTLPENFCCDCGKGDIVMDFDAFGRKLGGEAVWVIEHRDARPDLNLKPGDIIQGHYCYPCSKARPAVALYEPREYDPDVVDLDEELDDEGDGVKSWTKARAKRRWENVQSWVRAARLRGEEPAEFNGEGRKVKDQGVRDGAGTL